MLFGGLCENLESVHETEDKICHKAIQTALLSFLLNLFSGNISPFILGRAFILLYIL
jgi:hypothetical protein